MRKTQRLLVPLFLLFFSTFNVWADAVSKEAALEKAKALLLHPKSRSTAQEDIQLRAETPSVFLFENSHAFALIAADDRLPEVLGYGEKSSNHLPPPLVTLLKVENIASAVSTIDKCPPIAPLLPFVRHQESPYNNHCPYYKNDDGELSDTRCVVGCVATALEEIISYYRREIVLQDTLHGWETPHYTIGDILPGTSVDCRLIQNNYDTDAYTEAEADAVSRLSYYCGVAAHMNWGLKESGSNIFRLVEPLKRAFGYGYVKYVDSYQYSPSDWVKMMRQEIMDGRPVLYTAYNMWFSGHAFVIDGLDKDGLFHVNWGYGGDYDGYFRLDVLNFSEPPAQETPDGKEGGFFTNHQALLLHPDAIKVNLPDTLSRNGREVVIDSVTFDRVPETWKHTPISVFVRNTSSQTLTTPFEFFTNAQTDTALFDQGDFVALSTCTLQPYETKKITLHAAFEQAGKRIFRASPDDSLIAIEKEIVIADGRRPQLTFGHPLLSFPSPDQLNITLSISNAKDAGRAGQNLIYELIEGNDIDQASGVRHPHHLYLAPGETLTDTIHFQPLKQGQEYTLLVRSPWTVVASERFTTEAPTGIPSIPKPEDRTQTIWYTLDGQRIAYPEHEGIYLKRTGNKTEKIYLRNKTLYKK